MECAALPSRCFHSVTYLHVHFHCDKFGQYQTGEDIECWIVCSCGVVYLNYYEGFHKHSSSFVNILHSLDIYSKSIDNIVLSTLHFITLMNYLSTVLKLE